jgi:hypothetical protein
MKTFRSAEACLESEISSSVMRNRRMHGMLYGQNPQSEIRNPQAPSHASQERFGVEEATVTELVEFFESEKKCSVEPGGKPCDHCAMCSSRGF